MDDLRFDGQAVIVTGGCRGIGLGIAQRFAEAGAHVLVCCRNEPESLPAGVAFVAADVREPETGRRGDRRLRRAVRARRRARQQRRRLTARADSATASPRFTAGIIGFEPDRTDRVRAAGQRGDAVPGARRDDRRTSRASAACGPSPNTLAYGAAKAGLLNATKTMAVEFAPKVRVNAVVVGSRRHRAGAPLLRRRGGDRGRRRDGAARPDGRPYRRRRRVLVPRLAPRPLRHRRRGARARRRRASPRTWTPRSRGPCATDADRRLRCRARWAE